MQLPIVGVTHAHEVAAIKADFASLAQQAPGRRVLQ